MQPIRQQIEIAWPLKALFHYVADADTHPQWRPHVMKASWTNKNNAGSRLIDTQRVLGKDFLVVWRLTEVQVYHKRVLYRKSPSFYAHYIMEFESAGEHTVLTLTIQVAPKNKVLSRVLLLAMERESSNVLKLLKQTLESGVN